MNGLFLIIFAIASIEQITCFSLVNPDHNRYRSRPSGNPYGNRPSDGSYGNAPSGGSYENSPSGGYSGNTPPGGSYGNISPWNPQYKPVGPYGNPSNNHYGNKPPNKGTEHGSVYKFPNPHHFQDRDIPSVLKLLFKFNSYLASITKKLHKAKESLKTSKDEVSSLKTLLEELKEKIMSLSSDQSNLCTEGQIFSGKKCYTIVHRPKPFEDAQQKCLKDGGKLATADFTLESTFGIDILNPDPSRSGEKLWINGVRKDTNFVMENGYILPQDPADPLYRFLPNSTLTVPNSAVCLQIPNVGDTKWFIGVASTTMSKPFICEFKPKLNFGSVVDEV